MADALVKYLGKNTAGIYIALDISPPATAGRSCWRCDTSKTASPGSQAKGTGSSDNVRRSGMLRNAPWSDAEDSES